METVTELVPSASRSGLWRVLADGLHWFGAIIKKPWLQTAFSILNVDLLSPNAKVNTHSPPIFLFSFLAITEQALMHTKVFFSIVDVTTMSL